MKRIKPRLLLFVFGRIKHKAGLLFHGQLEVVAVLVHMVLDNTDVHFAVVFQRSAERNSDNLHCLITK